MRSRHKAKYLHGDCVWRLPGRLVVTRVERWIAGRDAIEELAAVMEFVDEVAVPTDRHLFTVKVGSAPIHVVTSAMTI